MKCKICPVCGKINIVSRILCDECREDLMQVVPCNLPEGESLPEDGSAKEAVVPGIGDTSPEKDLSSSDNSFGKATEDRTEDREKKGATEKYGRKCPNCGSIHSYREKRCSCGMLLLTQPPVLLNGCEEQNPEQNEEPKELYKLCTEDGLFSISLAEGDEFIVGRKNAGGKYLQDKSYVSGMHVKIKVSGGEVIMTHIGKTNPTLVNGRMIEPDKPIRLSPGDFIALGAKEGQGIHKEVGYFRLTQV